MFGLHTLWARVRGPLPERRTYWQVRSGALYVVESADRHWVHVHRVYASLKPGVYLWALNVPSEIVSVFWFNRRFKPDV